MMYGHVNQHGSDEKFDQLDPAMTYQSPLQALETSYHTKITYQRTIPTKPYGKPREQKWSSIRKKRVPSHSSFSDPYKSVGSEYVESTQIGHHSPHQFFDRDPANNYSSKDEFSYSQNYSTSNSLHNYYKTIPDQPISNDDIFTRNNEFSNESCQPIGNNKRPPPVEIDSSIPPEIAEMMQTNLCNICKVKLNSRIQSKTHYDGKPHAKKLKAAVQKIRGEDNDAGAETESSEASSAASPSKKRSISADGSELYCKSCDLSFTSIDHATQHYLGRNHQRVLHGLKPLRPGYFNKDSGKWQRMPTDPITPTERLVSVTGTESPSQSLGKEKGRFFCELCGVSTTSQDQLDGHNKGHKHKKMYQASIAKETSGSTDSLLESVSKEEAKKTKRKDFSIYRTPSGKFYCSCCDLTLNSETQFAQHVESKKHKLKKK